MATFLSNCARCGALIRFMEEPDPVIAHFCNQPGCVAARKEADKAERIAAKALEQKTLAAQEFEEAKKSMAEKKSLGQTAHAKMREARGGD